MPTKHKSLKHLTKKQVLGRLLKIAKGISKPEELTCFDDEHPEAAGCILQRLTGDKTLLTADHFWEYGINDLSEMCIDEIIGANDGYQSGSITKAEMVKNIKKAIKNNEPEEEEADA